MQFEGSGDDAKPHVHSKMEVYDETARREQLEVREKEITKEMLKLEGLKSKDEGIKNSRERELAERAGAN